VCRKGFFTIPTEPLRMACAHHEHEYKQRLVKRKQMKQRGVPFVYTVRSPNVRWQASHSGEACPAAIPPATVRVRIYRFEI